MISTDLVVTKDIVASDVIANDWIGITAGNFDTNKKPPFEPS